MSNQQIISNNEVFYDVFEGEERGGGRPTVSLESFFNGNEHEHSIGINLDNHPGLPLFFEVLQRIRSREDVFDVTVEITDIEIVETDDQYLWPFSQSVYIETSASEEEVSQWVKPLMPDEVYVSWEPDEPQLEPVTSKEYKVYRIYWH